MLGAYGTPCASQGAVAFGPVGAAAAAATTVVHCQLAAHRSSHMNVADTIRSWNC